MMLTILPIFLGILSLQHGGEPQAERVLPTASEYLRLRTKATGKQKQLRIPEWAKIREARLENTEDRGRQLVVVFREFTKHPLDHHLSVDVLLLTAAESEVPDAAVLLQVSGTPHEDALRGHLRAGFAALWSNQTGLRFVRFRADGATIHLALPAEFSEARFYSVSSMWYPSPEAGWVKPREFAACASAWKRETGELRGVAWSFEALASKAIRQLSKPPPYGEILPNAQ